MTDSQSVTQSGNPLASVLTATIRELYSARVVSEQRRELLSVAIETIHDLDRKLDRSRDENIHLRSQLRAFVSGRTIAEERQQLEDEAVTLQSPSEARAA